MLGLNGEESQRLMDDLIMLPRHLHWEADYIEFGSNWTDMCHAAELMAPTLWFPLAEVQKQTYRGMREVAPCKLRRVVRGVLPDDRLFCKFQLEAPGRTGEDMKNMLVCFNGTRQLILDRRHDGAFQSAIVKLLAHYLDARDAKKMRDVKHIDAAGQEQIIIGVGGT